MTSWSLGKNGLNAVSLFILSRIAGYQVAFVLTHSAALPYALEIPPCVGMTKVCALCIANSSSFIIRSRRDPRVPAIY